MMTMADVALMHLCAMPTNDHAANVPPIM